MIDEVRAGWRLDLRGSWEGFGVRPDLSAWSKAMANGHPIAAVTGVDALRGPAQTLYSTGSFWFSASAMAAAKATVEVLRDTGGVALMERAGDRLRAGLAAQAASHGFVINQTGPAQIPWLSFAGDDTLVQGVAWAAACLAEGVYLHPWHNWFLSTAHTDEEIDQALLRTDAAFAKLRKESGAA